MRAIEYLAPTSVAEATAILAAHGDRARPLAGGTDLIVQVRENLRSTDVFVDIKHIDELMTVRLEAGGGVTIGAGVACHDLLRHETVRRYSAIVDAARIIGGIAIQSRASLGGNLCNSGPAADSIPASIVHGATANIAGPGGAARSVPVDRFCTAPGRNLLGRGELVVSLTLPALAPHSGAAYQRFIPRGEMDIAEVGVAAQVTLEGDRITAARVALGAVAATPLSAPDAAGALVGRIAEEPAFEAAAELARAACRPITDMRGTAEHRTHLVGVLTRRVLAQCVARARGEAHDRH